jgi:starch-binding outer membrane protein, SusD/RagB family
MKFKHIIFTLLTVFAMSCSTDQEILDSLTTDNSLKTSTDVANFVNGVYGKLQQFPGFKLGYQTFFLSADDMYTRSGATYGARYSTKTPDAFTTETANFWVQLYQAINSANFLLERIDALKIDEAFKARIKGEMYFIRGLSYFYLVRMYGGVPLKTKSSELGQDFNTPRSSVDEIYALIFKDFEEANRLMIPRRSMPAAELGHAAKGAAQAMLAKAALTYAGYLELNGKAGEAPKHYTVAKNYADSVILSTQYNLINNFNDLWDVEKENAAYNEIIFAIMFTRDAQNAGAQSLGSEHGLQCLPANMPNVGGNGATRAGLGAFRIQPWFVKKYSLGDYVNDYRNEFTMLTQFTNNTVPARTVITYPRVKPVATGTELVENQPYMGKFIDGKAADSRNAANDFPIIRLAEVFLIKAEAENELNGPTAAAYAEINKLRARARNANGTVRTTPANLAAGLTKEQFREKIIDERAVEFLGEGIRWFDLTRLKSPDGKTTLYEYQFATVIPKLQKGLPTYNATTNAWGGGELETSAAPVYDKKQLLMPIPFNELQANKAMTQNFGY